MIDLTKLYARHARRFDGARVGSTMERPYLARVAALAPPPAAVLDLGCGSGEPIARWFVEHGHRVTGVDAVEEMLAIGRERLPAARWRRADMRRLDLGERFEIVVAWDSFFHLGRGDQRAMFETFRGHAAPGGVLLFTSGLVDGEEVGGDLFGDALFHASLDRAEYALLLDRHGFDVVLYRAEDPDCGRHTIWIARRRTEASP